MPDRILLIRHGPTAAASTPGWVNAHDFLKWRYANDASGIDPRSAPSAAVAATVARADVIVSSDLPRAVQTAERLASDGLVVQSPLLRETLLQVPGWIPVPLPVSAWDALAHADWGVGILRRNDPTYRDLHRASAAVDWLLSLKGDPPCIAVVTHGVFRRLLALALERRGWSQSERPRSHRHWSVWPFARGTPE